MSAATAFVAQPEFWPCAIAWPALTTLGLAGLGRYSNARPDQRGELRFLATNDPGQLAAFRTPSLRNVAERSPYTDRQAIGLSAADIQDLAAFLGALTGPVVQAD